MKMEEGSSWGQLRNQFLEERLSKRKSEVQKILMSKRLSLVQKTQEKLDKYLGKEEHEHIQVDLEPNMIQLEGNKETIEERGYPNPNLHQRIKKKKSKKKCWICRSFKHLKKSCPYMKCFYCSRYGHTKKECWRRKINYLFNKIMEECKHKEKKLTTKEKKKEKKKQRNLEMKVIEQRVSFTNEFLKKTQEREKWWLKWKDVELGEYTGRGNPQTIINKIREHDYKIKSLLVLLKKDTPLNLLTVYDEFSNWCGCGEIDQGKEVFIYHVRQAHKGVIPKN